MVFWNLFSRRNPQPDFGSLAALDSPQEQLEHLVKFFDLERVAPIIRAHVLPASGFRLIEESSGRSRLGGAPVLPPDAAWPERRGVPLAFLLQIDLADACAKDLWDALPDEGLLSFFYDVKEQPWGYDPRDLPASRVLYTPPGAEAKPRKSPDPSSGISSFGIEFFRTQTLPQGESTAYESLEAAASLTPKEADRYWGLIEALDTLQYGSSGTPHHRLAGHSENIQGDMQYEAELVSHGFNTGEGTHYDDPRALEHKPRAEDWRLLLQLDSDEAAGLTWGDLGMLYFWIRKDDARRGDWTKTWTALQST